MNKITIYVLLACLWTVSAVQAQSFGSPADVYKRQKLGFIFAESNPELELKGKVQAQWDYFETQQHKRRRAFIKEIK